MYICIYIYIYIYKKKKLFKAKPQVEVLVFGAYMFESLQSFNNSQVKAHSMFSMPKLQLICQNCRTSAISLYYEAAVIAKRAVKLM